jgi:hypothetical protein
MTDKYACLKFGAVAADLAGGVPLSQVNLGIQPADIVVFAADTAAGKPCVTGILNAYPIQSAALETALTSVVKANIADTTTQTTVLSQLGLSASAPVPCPNMDPATNGCGVNYVPSCIATPGHPVGTCIPYVNTGSTGSCGIIGALCDTSNGLVCLLVDVNGNSVLPPADISTLADAKCICNALAGKYCTSDNSVPLTCAGVSTLSKSYCPGGLGVTQSTPQHCFTVTGTVNANTQCGSKPSNTFGSVGDYTKVVCIPNPNHDDCIAKLCGSISTHDVDCVS